MYKENGEILTETKFFTPEDYYLLCDKLGNFFEMDNGKILWRFNGETLPVELVEQLLQEKDSLQLLEFYEITSQNHNKLVSNIHGTLRLALQNKPYLVYTQAPNIYIALTQKYRIPDAAVLPEKVELNDKKWVINPLIVVEVVSPSSEKLDFDDKLREYRSIETLQEYLIISQDELYIAHYTRHTHTQWFYETYQNKIDEIVLSSVGITLTLAEIYKNVEIITN
jgi:Uma2 family endonuclease